MSFRRSLLFAPSSREPNRNLRRGDLFGRTVHEQVHNGHDLFYVLFGLVLSGPDLLCEES